MIMVWSIHWKVRATGSNSVAMPVQKTSDTIGQRQEALAVVHPFESRLMIAYLHCCSGPSKPYLESCGGR